MANRIIKVVNTIALGMSETELENVLESDIMKKEEKGVNQNGE